MTTTPQTLKGFRDFLPADTIKRHYVIAKIRSLFERYGFLPIETPAVEYLETFTGNIGDDEKLFMKFEDHGGRKVALRYDQTVPTCRYVAQYYDKLTFPFKRYQIQPVWRAEKPQKGRYREFLQCDADIFGIAEPEADAEVIALSIEIYRELGFKQYVAKINDRAIYKDIPYEVIVSIDKLPKIGQERVIHELTQKGYKEADVMAWLRKITNASLTPSVEKIFKHLAALGFPQETYQFDPTIARSFNYSTGPIWEVVIPGYSAGSVLGGERYDRLVRRFSNRDIPATGFAVGFDRTIDAMEEFGLLPDTSTLVQVLVTVFSPDYYGHAAQTAAYLRNRGINTDFIVNPTAKMDKQLKYAHKNNIPYVVIIGPDEAAAGTLTLKNMNTGEQVSISRDELISHL